MARRSLHTQAVCGLVITLVGCSSEDAGQGGPDSSAEGSPSAFDTSLGDSDASVADSASESSQVDSSRADGDANTCTNIGLSDLAAAKRSACTFKSGARASDTLSLTASERAAIPIKHVIIVTQENRSFDHYFGRLTATGKTDVEGPPASFSNPDKNDASVKPFHLDSGCLPADPPHQGSAMVAGWNQGKMDGFVTSADTASSDGHYVMGYYDQTDLPFYYFLAKSYAMSDHYFGSALGGTWANRDYLYAATSDGVTTTGQKTISVPTIYDAMDTAKITWGVYTDGSGRQDCIGWKSTHAGLHKFSALLSALKDGTLPQVSYVDPGGESEDEHPPNEIHGGENWEHKLYDAAIASPLWSKLAIILTYDESGGLADHMPPPKACIPSADQTAFDRLGIRVPMVLVSPWARPGYVSHTTHDHTSTLRLVETLFDLPALTARDANADALLDMFEFDGCPDLLAPPVAADAGKVTVCP